MVHAFSFCLYGPYNSKYYDGLLQNLRLIEQQFPEWVTYVYLGSDVETTFVSQLESHAVRIRYTEQTGHINMTHRFFAIDEPDVDLMMVRDADSRVHARDVWAIRDFLSSPNFRAHAIRDHPEHGALLLGGLWGLWKDALPESIRALYADWVPAHAGFGNPTDPGGFGWDQNFLAACIYPRVRSTLLVHTPFRWPRYLFKDKQRPFPDPWSATLFCGLPVDGQA